MRVRAQVGDGHEPRQVHRLPHLLGHLQERLDQPRRAPSTCGSTTSRRSPASATRSAGRTRSAGSGGWELDRRRAGCSLKAGGPLAQARSASSANPDLPDARRLLRAVDLRLRLADHAPARRSTSRSRGRSRAVTGEPHATSSGARTGRTTSPARPSTRPPTRTCARRRGAGQARVRAGLHDVPAAHLRALPEPLLRRLVPVRARCTSARRTASCSSTRRRAAAGACASRGCPYKKVYFNWQHRQGREVQPLLPAHRGRACRRSARRPASGASATSAIVLYDADRVEAAASVARRAGTCSTPSSTSSSTRTTRRCARRRAATASRATGSTPPRRSPV